MRPSHPLYLEVATLTSPARSRSNRLATLPGQEDVAGLTALLDPSTLPGRVARINLLTRGSNALFLAMTPPRRPTPLPADAESEVRMNVDRHLGVDGPVLVHATG